jgi:hypothetical protein
MTMSNEYDVLVDVVKLEQNRVVVAGSIYFKPVYVLDEGSEEYKKLHAEDIKRIQAANAAAEEYNRRVLSTRIGECQLRQ